MKGQELAPNVARYGHRVEVTLLVAAAAAVIGGFVFVESGAVRIHRPRMVSGGTRHPTGLCRFPRLRPD